MLPHLTWIIRGASVHVAASIKIKIYFFNNPGLGLDLGHVCLERETEEFKTWGDKEMRFVMSCL